jgi:aspartate kinase
MVVMKFGGTSLGNGDCILDVARIVANEQKRQPVVVVSAMSQVTNALLELADNVIHRKHQAKVAAGIDRLRRQHLEAAKVLRLGPVEEEELLSTLNTCFTKLDSVLKSIYSLGKLTPRNHDLVISFGERFTVHLVVAALRQLGLAAAAIDGSELIVTNDNFGNASPLFPASCERIKPKLQPLLKDKIIPVITGFMGTTEDGSVTTLGRGGSDYSATIIGYCLGAEEVWIWTDVDGVMTADPRTVEKAHIVKELSYDEAAELSYFGAKVLHPRTMVAAARDNTPIFIKNTFRPDMVGTKIGDAASPHPNGAKATTVLNQLSLITIQGKGMQGVLGVAAKVFTTLAKQRINVLLISQASSENNISLATSGNDGSRAVSALEEAFRAEFITKNLEVIREESPVAMIAVVGEGMRNHIGIAGRIFSTLGRANINVVAIAQGSSELNISFIVQQADAALALQSVHDELHLENNGSNEKARL